MPDAKVELLRGPGHLAHEKEPARVAEAIMNAVAVAISEAGVQ
jgi:hypothetical protein